MSAREMVIAAMRSDRRTHGLSREQEKFLRDVMAGRIEFYPVNVPIVHSITINLHLPPAAENDNISANPA